MPKIKEIQAKSIITKSNLPASDYVINPYTGCEHSCIYCYARFMKRFSGHTDEEWGSFIDVKINAPELIPNKIEKFKGKHITIGSVTDPYQPIEKKYQLTRKILKKIIPFNSSFNILTKSSLVARDVDILTKFKDIVVAFSICSADEKIRKNVDPGASSFEKKLNTLKNLRKNNISTVVFISPILPYLTDWKKIINATSKYADEYWFENLNIYPSINGNIFTFLAQNYPKLIPEYKEIIKNPKLYWDQVEKEIRKFCAEKEIKYQIFFHHKDIKKK